MIVAGFGFRRGATVLSLRDAMTRAGHSPDLLASPALKAQSSAFQEFAEMLGLPVRDVDPDTLRAQDTTTHSQASQQAHGTGSVAEASALAAAGPGAVLLSARCISGDRLATCAMAKGVMR